MVDSQTTAHDEYYSLSRFLFAYARLKVKPQFEYCDFCVRFCNVLTQLETRFCWSLSRLWIMPKNLQKILVSRLQNGVKIIAGKLTLCHCLLPVSSHSLCVQRTAALHRSQRRQYNDNQCRKRHRPNVSIYKPCDRIPCELSQ